LADVLIMFKGKDKNYVAKTLRFIYSRKEDEEIKVDERYDLLMGYFDRLQKAFNV
jgi:hypothetical protein